LPPLQKRWATRRKKVAHWVAHRVAHLVAGAAAGDRMTPAAILATVEAKGARLQVVDGDRIAVTPKGALDDALRAEIKRAKPALLALLKTDHADDMFANATIYTHPFTVYGTPEDAPAIIWAEETQHPDVVRTLGILGRRCEGLIAEGTDDRAAHDAVAQLTDYLRTIREAYETAHRIDDPVDRSPGPWRLVVTSTRLRPPPIRLDAARSVVRDVAGHVEILLAKLSIAVEHRNAGRATYYAALIDEWLGELTLCGVDASLEVVQ
jgi:hypothetical protein